MTLLLVLLTVLLMISLDFRKTKSPFDDQEAPFDLKDDWWKKRYDDIIPMFLSGMIGGILSSEIGAPVIHWVATTQLNLSEGDFLENIAIDGMELTSVFVVTLIVIRKFTKKE
jgi:hypothetical protein